MIRTERRLRLCIALLVLILGFIWGNSLLPGEVSGAFSNWVQQLLTRIFGAGEPREGSGLLRKIAHFSEFAALGACLLWLMAMLGKKAKWALLPGFAAACVDETIQCFVPDRGPSPVDVGIDTCGVMVGIMVLHFGYLFMKRKQNQQYMEEM